jgi:hypothetical protein
MTKWRHFLVHATDKSIQRVPHFRHQITSKILLEGVSTPTKEIKSIAMRKKLSLSRLLATMTSWNKKRPINKTNKRCKSASPLRVVVSTCVSEDSASLKPPASVEEIEVALTPEASLQTSHEERATQIRQPTVRHANTTTKSFAEEEKEENGAAPSEQEVGVMLRNLRESNTLEEATVSIKTLYTLLNGPDSHTTVRKDSARMIAQLNGAGAILLALQRWYPVPEEEFSTFAIRSLIQICRFFPQAKENIVNIGGAGTVLAAAEHHSQDLLVTANAVGLLCNLSSYAGTTQDVANEKCIDFVVRAMKRFPNHRFIQRNGCAYLSCIGEIEGMNHTFRQKDIDFLLLQTFNSFREREHELAEVLFINKCKEIQAFAKLGMVIYMSGIQRGIKV